MARARQQTLEAKIVLLGDTGVGKTSIAYRYTQDEGFQHMTNPTIGAEFLLKNVQVDEFKLKLQIWDTAGQEKFRSLAPMYYRGAKAALLVYDITSTESFNRVKDWVNELKTNLTEEIIMQVVGNKKDKESQREVHFEEASAYANLVGANYFETSAKTKEGIEEVFDDVAVKIVEAESSAERSKSNESSDETVDLHKTKDSQGQKKDEDTCCP
eukprot:TRINITY_DN80_c0_g1_i2.p1 TRINITY_DN80_c0_g1~~TRINITY_DN80_c0_g1_i2.p1  ORF type:complete len:213 (+),score=48.34 TRINITY_DN80_c0_g1_i2:42-680(+)